jgi:hypothetical protein
MRNNSSIEKRRGDHLNPNSYLPEELPYESLDTDALMEIVRELGYEGRTAQGIRGVLEHTDPSEAVGYVAELVRMNEEAALEGLRESLRAVQEQMQSTQDFIARGGLQKNTTRYITLPGSDQVEIVHETENLPSGINVRGADVHIRHEARPVIAQAHAGVAINAPQQERGWLERIADRIFGVPDLRPQTYVRTTDRSSEIRAAGAGTLFSASTTIENHGVVLEHNIGNESSNDQDGINFSSSGFTVTSK